MLSVFVHTDTESSCLLGINRLISRIRCLIGLFVWHEDAVVPPLDTFFERSLRSASLRSASLIRGLRPDVLSGLEDYVVCPLV